MTVPVKRRLSKINTDRISPSTIAAYAHALELRKRARRGEVDLSEVAEAEKVVERALSIRMWQASVFDLDRLYGPDDPSYARAAELRAGLDAALAARRQRATATPEQQPATI